MLMGKSAKSCAQLKAEPPCLLRLITKNVAVNSNIVKREKCKYYSNNMESMLFLPVLVLIVYIIKLMKWNLLNNTKI